MSNIYYAKFNVNEDIFKIYKITKLSDILEYVLLNMDSKIVIEMKTNVKYRFYRINKDFKKYYIWLVVENI